MPWFCGIGLLGQKERLSLGHTSGMFRGLGFRGLGFRVQWFSLGVLGFRV